jgi:large subunit ribosomal protein L16
LQAQQGSYITNKQIEAARKVISKFVKKFGEMRINIFPHLAKTKKSIGGRMGSGKGSVDSHVSVVKEGTVMFEVKNLSKNIAYQALKAASYKLPVRCQVVEKNSIC